MIKLTGKLFLPFLLMIHLTGIADASYGDGVMGDVIYGDAGGVAVIEAELALALSATLSHSNIATTTNLLTLLASASDSHEATVSFVKELSLMATAEMAHTNQLDGVSVLLLNKTIQQANINIVNITSLMALTAQVSEIYTTGGTYEADVALEAISSLILSAHPEYTGSLSLTAQNNIALASRTAINGVVSLIAQGEMSQAVSLIANASTVLNATGSMSVASQVNWIKMLSLGTTVATSFNVSGEVYDSALDLAMAVGVAWSGGLAITGEVSLDMTTQIENIVAQAISEGVVTLNARGSYESATQLAAVGTVLLRGIATQTLGFNQNLTVTTLLNAIASAVITEDFGGLAQIIRIQFSLKKPTATFSIGSPYATFELTPSGE